MPHPLTRRNVSALAKLDFSTLGHAQRIEAIAQALGYATGAALMASLKSSENTTQPPNKARAIMAFGSEMTRRVSDFDEIIDSCGDIVSGDLSLVEFDTHAELTAYQQGIDDAQGWMDAYVFADESEEPQHAIFRALETEPDIARAYEIARAETRAEEDDEDDA